MQGRFSRRKLLWIVGGVALFLAALTPILQRAGKIDSPALIQDAELALASRDYKTAGAVLDKVLAFEPTNRAALIQRGILWESIGEFEQAIADWGQVDAVDAIDGSSKMAGKARWLEGALQVKLHRAAAAERALLESWEFSKKDNLASLELLLRVYVLQMRREAIRQVLNMLEQYRPLSLEEMVLKTDAGAPIVDPSEAIPQLRAFIEGDPSDLPSAIALARYLMSSEKFQETLSFLESLPQQLGGQSPIVGLKALCQLKLGFPQAAFIGLNTPNRAASQDYWWWLAAGELAEFDKQKALAADILRLAAQAQPDSGYARYRYGLALQAIGQTQAAQAQLQAAAAIDRLHKHTEAINRIASLTRPQFVDGLLQIALVEQELHNPAEARAWARFALQLDPANTQAIALNRAATDDRPGNLVQGTVRDEAVQANVLKWLRGHALESVPIARSAETLATGHLHMVDVHQAAQLDFQYFNGNSGSKYLIEAMGGGVGILDFDSDGWPDCYFPQGCKFPIDLNDFTYLDQLYRNQDGQRFINVTAAARLFENGYSQGVSAGDINNDGWVDVVVANFGRNRIFINQGDGTFIDATDAWGLERAEMSSSLALSDLDGDGNLDLYVVNYVDELRVCRDSAGHVSTCNPQNFKGLQDRLYQNSGDGRFVDVTEQAGVLAEDSKGLGVVVTDLDDDGLVDIYVANDTTPNLLFKNLGGMRFEEVGLASGTALSDEGQAQAGMGIAAGDLNGDLRTDLFVTNFFLESNNLYINGGSMNFKDEAMQAKLTQPSKNVLGFGTQAEDIDLDGDLDLIVANGHIDDYSTRGDPWKMPTQLFCNLGGGVFRDVTQAAGEYFKGKYLGRGVASLDWNRDGRRDFIVVHQDRAVALLENQTQTLSSGMSIRLIGRTSNRDAIGATVIVESTMGKKRRDLHGGAGFYCSNEPSLTVGATDTLTIDIAWPNGEQQSLALNRLTGEMIITEK